MASSLKLVPDSGYQALLKTDAAQLANAAQIYDTLRHGPQSHAVQHNNKHPLQHRLEAWTNTQEALRLQTMRNVYGAAEPIRRGMEIYACQTGYRPIIQGPPVGLDILKGTDTKLDVEDIWTGEDSVSIIAGASTFHDEMERGMRTHRVR